MKDAYEISLGCWLRSRYKVSNLPFYDHVLMSELGFQIVIGSPDNCLKKNLLNMTYFSSTFCSWVSSLLPSYRFASVPSPLRNPE